MDNYYFINYGILLITLLITLGAQGYINYKYNKTSKIQSKISKTGKETAEKILKENELKNVKVTFINGNLTDYYDPRKKMVKLSEGVYDKTNIAAISVSAHECGHAIQDKNNFFFLRLRSALVPIVNISSSAGYIAILIGVIFSSINFIWIGIILEAAILLFQVITLPVEFDASARALKQLESLNILDDKELKEAKGILTAAALTYVASVATSLLEILRLVMLYTRRED